MRCLLRDRRLIFDRQCRIAGRAVVAGDREVEYHLEALLHALRCLGDFSPDRFKRCGDLAGCDLCDRPIAEHWHRVGLQSRNPLGRMFRVLQLGLLDPPEVPEGIAEGNRCRVGRWRRQPAACGGRRRAARLRLPRLPRRSARSAPSGSRWRLWCSAMPTASRTSLSAGCGGRVGVGARALHGFARIGWAAQ